MSEVPMYAELTTCPTNRTGPYRYPAYSASRHLAVVLCLKWRAGPDGPSAGPSDLPKT
jgi:hypothetical protein